MNEFQKAFNVIMERLYPSVIKSNYTNEEEKIKELVDKATPMKVKNIKPAGHSLYLGECPRCNTEIDYLDYPYTCCAKGCRQALDWGVTKNE